MGLEILKRYSSHSFHSMLAKLYEDFAYDGGIQALTILSNQRSLTKIMHFKSFLNTGPYGAVKFQNDAWNISKTADCRAKRTKRWDSGSYNIYM